MDSVSLRLPNSHLVRTELSLDVQILPGTSSRTPKFEELKAMMEGRNAAIPEAAEGEGEGGETGAPPGEVVVNVS